MPRIVTALFEDRATAERALQALMAAGVPGDRIAIIGEDKGHEVSSISGFRELSARDDTLAALHDLALPDADTQLFEEGLRRGCALLSARIDGPDIADAIQVIETFDPIDLDRRSQDWAQQHPVGGSGGAVGTGAPLGAGITGGSGAGTSTVESLPGMGTLVSGTTVLGTADLQTQEMSLADEGGSTTATGDRRADERAGAPGVTELGAPNDEPVAGQGVTGVSPVNPRAVETGKEEGQQGPRADAHAAAALDPSMAGLDTAAGSRTAYREAELATKVSPNPVQSPGTDARPDFHHREMAGTGRVRSYVRNT